MLEVENPPIQDLVEEWLEKAENPSSRMEAELISAKEKIKQLEHEIREEKKVMDLKKQEDNLKTEKLEKVIIVMAKAIKNLQEGKDTELSSRKEKALEEAQLKLQKSETEKQKLSEQLDEATKEKEKVNVTMKTL